MNVVTGGSCCIGEKASAAGASRSRPARAVVAHADIIVGRAGVPPLVGFVLLLLIL